MNSPNPDKTASPPPHPKSTVPTQTEVPIFDTLSVSPNAHLRNSSQATYQRLYDHIHETFSRNTHRELHEVPGYVWLKTGTASPFEIRASSFQIC